jgi:hypothetical protein
MTTFKANTTSRCYQTVEVNKYNSDRINPSLLFETPGNFKKKLDNYLYENENLYNNFHGEETQIKQRPQSVNLQKYNNSSSQNYFNCNFYLLIFKLLRKNPSLE